MKEYLVKSLGYFNLETDLFPLYAEVSHPALVSILLQQITIIVFSYYITLCTYFSPLLGSELFLGRNGTFLVLTKEPGTQKEL